MKNILVVDDEKNICEILSEVLIHEGFSVDTADNGLNAMTKIRSNPPDILITDMLMPESDGIEILMELREMKSNIKVIAISGGGRINSEHYLDIAGKLGSARSLAKPFRINELIETINSI